MKSVRMSEEIEIRQNTTTNHTETSKMLCPHCAGHKYEFKRIDLNRLNGDAFGDEPKRNNIRSTLLLLCLCLSICVMAAVLSNVAH